MSAVGHPKGAAAQVACARRRLNARSRGDRRSRVAQPEPALPNVAWLCWRSLLMAAVVLPFLVSNYRVFQFTLVLVYAIAILGLNMLTGFNGQISLGHGAFYAIGAYTAAIMMDQARRAVLADAAGRRRGLLRRRLPVRAARRCAWRASTWRWPRFALGARDAAAAQVQAPRALDRRRAGHRARQARAAAVRPASPQRRPLALLLHAGGRRSSCSSGVEPAARPRRPRADRDPRPSDRRRGDGHQPAAVQVADLRRVSAHVHRRRRRAGRDRDRSSSRPTASPSRCRSSLLVGVVVGGLASIPGALLRRASSSSSCRTSPTRCRRRRRRRSTASC